MTVYLHCTFSVEIKNLKFMKIDELRMCRGRVIEKFVAIEQFITELITRHYFGKENYDFTLNVLGDDQSNFGFKRNIFLHLFKPEKRFIDNLNNLNKIRNIFSHAPLTHKHNENEYFFRKVDSENPINMDLNPKNLSDEFDETFPLVLTEFKKISENKGWPFEPNPILFT